MTVNVLGAVELGGTKIKLATGTSDGTIITELSFPTAGPDAAFELIRQFFSNNRVRAIGVGAFGPVNVSPGSSHFGRIGNTPKPGWAGFGIIGALAPLGIPIAIDTDVNAALLGEACWGAAADCNVAAYLTVGTGIGGGLIIDGRPVHGLLHPEMGHMRVLRALGDDLQSQCPYHSDCAEGLASGPAILARFGAMLCTLPAEHYGHSLIANYIAQVCVNVILVTSPQVIIIGGGVMSTPHLLPMIRRQIDNILNDYLKVESSRSCGVFLPSTGDFAGLLGGLALARNVAI